MDYAEEVRGRPVVEADMNTYEYEWRTNGKGESRGQLANAILRELEKSSIKVAPITLAVL